MSKHDRSKWLPIEAIKKAVEATNLCTTHMAYHGQQSKDCKVEKRRVIELGKDKDES